MKGRFTKRRDMQKWKGMERIWGRSKEQNLRLRKSTTTVVVIKIAPLPKHFPSSSSFPDKPKFMNSNTVEYKEKRSSGLSKKKNYQLNTVHSCRHYRLFAKCLLLKDSFSASEFEHKHDAFAFRLAGRRNLSEHMEEERRTDGVSLCSKSETPLLYMFWLFEREIVYFFRNATVTLKVSCTVPHNY